MIRGTIAASVAAARSSSREEIEEVEDDEGSDEEEDMHNNDYQRVIRNGTRDANGRVGSQASATLSPAEGLMLLPADDTYRTLAPLELLPILVRLIKDERLPIRSQYLYRLLQNIAKKPLLRDAILRLLVCLLIEDENGANNTVQELTNNAEIKFDFMNDNDDTNAITNDIVRSNASSRRAYAVPNTAQKGNKTLSQLAASRLVAVLFHLSSANVSCVYDMLRPRIRRGGPAIKTEVEIVENGEDNEEKDEIKNEEYGGTKSEEPVIKGASKNEEKVIGKEAEKEEQLEGQSTDSLLEMLMPLFSHVNFASNANDLSELTAFINVVSTPLEFLSESVSENRTVSANFIFILTVVYLYLLSVFACAFYFFSTIFGGILIDFTVAEHFFSLSLSFSPSLSLPLSLSLSLPLSLFSFFTH